MEPDARPAAELVLYVHRWGEAGPRLVCVHGLTRSGADFGALGRALATERRVMAPDVHGRGRSAPLPEPRDYHVDRYAQDLIEMLGDEPVDWLGTSMGGLIGIRVALTRPGLIRRLILNDVGPQLETAGLGRILTYLGKPFRFATREEALAHHRTTYAPFGPLSDEQWEELGMAVLAFKDGGWQYAYDLRIVEGLRPGPDWSDWERLSVPCMVLRGENSDILSRETARKMSGKARIEEIPLCGHAPPLMSAHEHSLVRHFLGTAAH